MTTKQESKRIYYLSKTKKIGDYMTKIYGQRIFTMKSATQFKFLPVQTRKAVEELQSYNCEIKYIIL